METIEIILKSILDGVPVSVELRKKDSANQVTFERNRNDAENFLRQFNKKHCSGQQCVYISQRTTPLGIETVDIHIGKITETNREFLTGTLRERLSSDTFVVSIKEKRS